MSTYSIHFYENIRKFSIKYLKVFVFLSYWKNFLGLKNEFETATVNEPGVF